MKPIKIGNRRTGLSTAIILNAISDSMRNPGIKIEVKDHFRTFQSQIYHYETTKQIISKLGLDITVMFKDGKILIFNHYRGILDDGKSIKELKRFNLR